MSTAVRTPRNLGLAVAIGVTCCAAHAQTVPSARTAFGAGSTPCSKYADLYATNEEAGGVKMVGSWAQGYLSATNDQRQRDGQSTLKSVDPEIITLFIYNFCQANPRRRVEAATLALIDDLSKPK